MLDSSAPNVYMLAAVYVIECQKPAPRAFARAHSIPSLAAPFNIWIDPGRVLITYLLDNLDNLISDLILILVWLF